MVFETGKGKDFSTNRCQAGRLWPVPVCPWPSFSRFLPISFLTFSPGPLERIDLFILLPFTAVENFPTRFFFKIEIQGPRWRCRVERVVGVRKIQR